MPRKAVSHRLDPDLLERTRVRAAELGQTQTVFIERALEAALSDSTVENPKTAKALAPETMRQLGRPAPPRSRHQNPAMLARQARLEADRARKR